MKNLKIQDIAITLDHNDIKKKNFESVIPKSAKLKLCFPQNTLTEMPLIPIKLLDQITILDLKQSFNFARDNFEEMNVRTFF